MACGVPDLALELGKPTYKMKGETSRTSRASQGKGEAAGGASFPSDHRRRTNWIGCVCELWL